MINPFTPELNVQSNLKVTRMATNTLCLIDAKFRQLYFLSLQCMVTVIDLQYEGLITRNRLRYCTGLFQNSTRTMIFVSTMINNMGIT